MLNRLPKTTIGLLLFTGAVFTACWAEGLPDNDDDSLSAIRIPVAQIPLYADLHEYDLTENAVFTRSSEETVTLESLLDYENTVTRTSENYEITQVPFKQNEENVFTLTFSADHDAAQDDPTRVKKFYVSAVSGTGERYQFVCVMVTSAEYAEKNPEFNWFEKPYYTGVIFFCTPEGELIQNCDYSNGRIVPTKMLTPEESESNTDPLTKRVVLLTDAATRSDIPWWSNGWAGAKYWGAVCIDFTPLHPTGGGGGGTGNDDPPGANNNNGHGNNTQDGFWDNNGMGALLPNIPPEIAQIYSVELSSNQKSITMLGGGSFEEGTVTYIDFQQDNWVETVNFSRWTGDFRVRQEARFSYKVTQEIKATAYFNVKNPCTDLERGIYAPLEDMRVAATGSGSYINGTFDAFRGFRENGTKNIHKGIDLKAKPGTPAYAVMNGRIRHVYSTARAGKPGKGDGRGYGNHIIIECEAPIDPYNDDWVFQDMKKVYIQYSHLQHGNAIAINPRTGTYFAAGDQVYAGDLIGYTGNTGNAFNVPNPHLHFSVSYNQPDQNGRITNNNWRDPLPYINADVDMEQLKREFGQPDAGKLITKCK